MPQITPISTHKKHAGGRPCQDHSKHFGMKYGKLTIIGLGERPNLQKTNLYKFNMLAILGRAPVFNDNDTSPYVTCVCECTPGLATPCTARLADVLSGHTASCGCGATANFIAITDRAIKDRSNSFCRMIFAANARKPWHQAEIGLKYDIAKELVGSCVRRHQRALLAMHEADIKRVGSMKFAGCDELWTCESNWLKKKVYSPIEEAQAALDPIDIDWDSLPLDEQKTFANSGMEGIERFTCSIGLGDLGFDDDPIDSDADDYLIVRSDRNEQETDEYDHST